jgi:hypothetical protein
MITAKDYYVTVVEMPGFSRDADRLLSEDERQEMASCLACHPVAGDPVDGVACVWVFRWPPGKLVQKRSFRVVYFFRDLNMPVYLLALYEKEERLSITRQDKEEMKSLAKEIVELYGLQWTEQDVPNVGAA